MAELKIIFLKPEFCRFEEAYKDLKVRIKITDVYDALEANTFTAKITSQLGMEYILEDWEEVITGTTTKLNKEYDLNLVTFLSGSLPLNIGTHTLTVQINSTITSSDFIVSALTAERLKSEYLLGVELESRTDLVFIQELRKITGIELLEISKETYVGPKELTWNATDQTLQWDGGIPVEITDDYTDYTILNYMGAEPGVVDGDYIKVRIEDPTLLPAESVTEIAIVDSKNYEYEDYRYWINHGYRVVTEAMIMTDLEPTLYSTDKTLGYKVFDPVIDIPKSQSATTNLEFELPINMVQEIIELWAQPYGKASKTNIDVNRVEFTQDGHIVVFGYPYDSTWGGKATLALSGHYDRTIYAKTGYRDRNKTKNYWHATIIAGITDEKLRSLALEIASKVAMIDIFIQAGLASGAGIASRSFSVGGISSSISSVESAENSKYSSSILQFERSLGIGRATDVERKNGLVQALKNKIQGGSMMYKF